MAPAIALPSESPRKTLMRMRIVVFLAVACVLASAIFFVSDNKSPQNKLIKAVAVARPPDNTVLNPAPTPGPNCSSRIMVLIDRSGSMFDPNNNRDKVASVKSTLNQFFTDAGTEVAAANGRLEVDLLAFATATAYQNYIRPPETLIQWRDRLNIADPASLALTKALVGQNPNSLDGIWFIRDSSRMNEGDLGPSAGYDPNNVIDLSRNYYNSTNYEDAFGSATQIIDFWTAADTRGNDDWDLVIMITDGSPTANDDGDRRFSPDDIGVNLNPNLNDNEVVFNGSGVGYWDLAHAQNAVNDLRTGAPATNSNEIWLNGRAPVPVVGILAGDQAPSSFAQDNMRNVFGQDASGQDYWYPASDFGTALGEQIRTATYNALGGGLCQGPKQPVQAALSVTQVRVEPSLIEEASGQKAVVHVTVANTGTVDLKNIQKSTLAPGNNEWPFPGPITQLSGGLKVGESREFTFAEYEANLGTAGGIKNYNFRISGEADVNTATQVLQGPSTVMTQNNFSYTVKPLPLPS